MKTINEGSAVIDIPEEKKVSKQLEVFYNPSMKLNRDITVLLLNAVENKGMQIADIMAGTGVRSIRLAKELNKGKVKRLYVNDMSSIKYIKKNISKNKVKAELSSKEANEFLIQSSGFDYIDVDPFGTPNPFLDASIRRISRNGILGITATDTAVLCGTYPKTARREYWAETCRNGFMHESALRILIRKVQLIGGQYDKTLIPILSYAKEHYVRVFFRCIKGRKKAAELMNEHRFILYDPRTLAYEVSEKNFKDGYVAIGPLYVGKLQDKALIDKMLQDVFGRMARKTLAKGKEDPFVEANSLLQKLRDELDIVGCYDLHELTKLMKIRVPEYEPILNKLNATRTHYNPYAIKTTKSLKELKQVLEFAR